MGYDQTYDVAFDTGRTDRRLGRRRDRISDADLDILGARKPGWDDGYAAGHGPTVIDMDAVACILRRRGFERAFVEQTGGGTATIQCDPTHEEEDWGTRWAALAGPGHFEGPAWTKARGDVHDFYIGPDDDGETDPVTPWSTDPEVVADIIETWAHSNFRGTSPEIACRFASAQRRFGEAERELAHQLEAMAVSRIRAMFLTAATIHVTGERGEVDMLLTVDRILDADGGVLYDTDRTLTPPYDSDAYVIEPANGDSIEDVESDFLNWLATLDDDWQGENIIEVPDPLPAAATRFEPSTDYACEAESCRVQKQLTVRTESSERYCRTHFPWD